MSPGHGCDYLLKSVAVGDGNRSLRTPMTRYYTEAGTPPGVWLGSGVREFGAGQLAAGAEVTPAQLELLLVHGRDPVTGEQLGRAYPTYPSSDERGPKSAVSGFDLTFSVPKSVSVLWGLADADIQAQLVRAHHDAVAEVLGFFEREVAVTRAGANARNGAVAQHEVAGVAATAYDHWDSRCGDPQLHTHVVVSNKVRTVYDQKWRSLDSVPIHRSVVAISEHYNAVLADLLTRRLGVSWDCRDRGADRNNALEITGVGEQLVKEFSNRSRDVDVATDRLIEEYVAAYGRRPSTKTIIELRATATISTRPEKELHSLAELTAGWRDRAQSLLSADPATWARDVVAHTDPVALCAEDVPHDVVAEAGRRVVAVVGEKRSTWRHWNLWAEATRQTNEWRFATPRDREAVVALIVDAATGASIRLTPPELAVSPEAFRWEDGSSRFRPRQSAVFSSADLLAAEDRLLVRANTGIAPSVDLSTVKNATNCEVLGHHLSDGQASALAQIATSGRQIDLLVGPAGAGKTTAMRALHAAWTTTHGTGSVVGLAPSAAAAQVLADDLGIVCDNTAKWLHEHDHGRAAFTRGQLVIIDEATLGGTGTLDRITGLAADAGAKVLLVGDGAQLQSVDAGGAFSMLADARDDTPELVDILRFDHHWETTATAALRAGDTDVIGTYLHNDRIHSGTTDEMTDAAYSAWRTDLRAGLASVLVTEATATVTTLNQRARAERILNGETEAGREVELADGNRASTGDVIITRRNQRQLRSLRGGWVRNGDRWRVTDVLRDGSVLAARLGQKTAGAVVLPAPYVRESVDLGYAITAHRAQGMTVETAHVVASGRTNRENLYVSMTRGRRSNTVYIALDDPDDAHTPPQDGEVTARTVLYGILKRSGAELSAHQMIEAEHEHWSSIAQLAAEYETIAADAQRDRWAKLIEEIGLDDADVECLLASESYAPLTVEFRSAEANGYDLETLLPRLVASRGLADVHDLGAVLISRLHHATAQPKRTGRRRTQPNLIVGFIPAATGAMTADHRQALDERRALIEARATALAERAIQARDPWIAAVGPPPQDADRSRAWHDAVRVVAAYRDRYDIAGAHPFGTVPESATQRADRAHAAGALRRAQELARETAGSRVPEIRSIAIAR
ncbi:conjugative relaxase-like TrwC/TraI family protein [Nocardioides massiliensis]|uniref:Conjugative relaxase-like TrwC/TraI family protein n=2 Tax=Nocardioides massiliensis TaxID=1325935 RepID=A0ABT9NSJ7_9ACTN|nr:MobF family relaxase [Nocardioides massiliensis]MDP9823291.1 conjugative relaxase-like TrwC/TraI family protein [Nocardioides massiliensis]